MSDFLNTNVQYIFVFSRILFILYVTNPLMQLLISVLNFNIDVYCNMYSLQTFAHIYLSITGHSIG